MVDTFSTVCNNFDFQAGYANKMGSPFYCELLKQLGTLIERDSPIGRVFSSWPSNPQTDAVALRFVAALNYLVITNQDKDLVAIFPPSTALTTPQRETILREAIARHQKFIIDYLKSPPQTNEVGRSMVLIGGFLEIAKRFGRDMDIFEVGASAGLNLFFDDYYYQCDDWSWGNLESTVRFTPNWDGKPPPLGPIKVHNRRACDLSPVNVLLQKDRLLSYVWPDQVERVQRITAAIGLACDKAPEIDQLEAAQWLEKQLGSPPDDRTRVFYHSIIWQYFSDEQKHQFSTIMKKNGRAAAASAPLIWMRLEPQNASHHAELRCTIWPGEKELVLAQSGFHGEWVRWFGAD